MERIDLPIADAAELQRVAGEKNKSAQNVFNDGMREYLIAVEQEEVKTQMKNICHQCSEILALANDCGDCETADKLQRALAVLKPLGEST